MPATSPLVTHASALRTDTKPRTAPVYGVTVHCSGSSIVESALRAGRDPLERAVGYYTSPGAYYGHYAIGFGGEIAQIADELAHAPHIGLTAIDHGRYVTGGWEHDAPAGFAAAWHARWPGYRTPMHLFPGSSPNGVYVGIELLVWVDGCAGRPLGRTSHTEAQHVAAARLAADIAERHGLPSGWQRSGRLACHEDLTPLSRSNARGGWDPGVIKLGGAAAGFDWARFVAETARVESGRVA